MLRPSTRPSRSADTSRHFLDLVVVVDGVVSMAPVGDSRALDVSEHNQLGGGGGGGGGDLLGLLADTGAADGGGPPPVDNVFRVFVCLSIVSSIFGRSGAALNSAGAIGLWLASYLQ